MLNLLVFFTNQSRSTLVGGTQLDNSPTLDFLAFTEKRFGCCLADGKRKLLDGVRDLSGQRWNILGISSDDGAAQKPVEKITRDCQDNHQNNDVLDLRHLIIDQTHHAVAEPVPQKKQQSDTGNSVNGVRQDKARRRHA